MMISLRKAADRGATRLAWLDSRHTFSFGDYHDPRFTGFRDLLVINEDKVLPGGGFPTHPHRDMEIVSYVLAGALAHRDSLGTGSIIRSGEVQRMSAGTGIRHSEYNASQSEPVHFLQIWIAPERAGLAPGYEQVALPAVDGASRLDLIGGPGGPEAVRIHQDVALWRARLQPGKTLALPIAGGRAAWAQMVAGRARINGHDAAVGDGVALVEEREVTMTGIEAAELLVFDLA
jgi:redox-sensitive bicupin YhaK (pirin superfamily)